MDLSEEMWNEVGYVVASKYRIKIMKAINNGTKTPSQIAEDISIPLNRVSLTLAGLREHELVVCINPQIRKGRLYRLTSKGEKVIKKIE